MTSKSILALAGDGIGPEIMTAALKVLQAAAAKTGVSISIETGAIGGAAYDEYGVPLTDDTIKCAEAADAVLLGAVGGPKWNDVDRDKRPEAGLLRLRKELELFANLRPALCQRALSDASSLKAELIADLDIMIVRELTGGVYFGEPRGIETLRNGKRRAVDTQVYTEEEIDRICRTAFDVARRRDKRVCSVEKSNVMETGVLWRDVASKVGAEYPDVDLSHMYADNCAMQLVRAPKQFDVIVTDNLFGDILSDCAAMLTGSLGMLASASLGAPREDGRVLGVYEPVHGSAPDITGTGAANPLAMIGSVIMACEYSLGLPKTAALIENSVSAVLESGLRTADIAMSDETIASTHEMGEAVTAAL